MEQAATFSPKERALRDYDENFITYWKRAFSQLKAASEKENRMWLVGPTAYLFSIGGVKFAVDLQIRRETDMALLAPGLSEDLRALSFVLITHQHDDHFCIPLIRQAQELAITWYLPQNMPAKFAEAAGIRTENVKLLQAGDRFSVGPLTVSAFYTPHAQRGAEPYPQLGYWLKTPLGSVLLPADVRDYGFRDYPAFGPVDLCISHVWAGNDAINECAYTPLLEQFAQFSLQFGAKRYFLCHLYEIGRAPQYLWHEGHARQAAGLLVKQDPHIQVDVPRLGCSYELF